MITAGRVGVLESSEQPATVIALEDEVRGTVLIRYAGAEGGLATMRTDSVSWADPPPTREEWAESTTEQVRRRVWWRTDLNRVNAFLPFEFVFTVATMAERNNIALDVAYIAESGSPVDIEDVTVLDMGYAGGAILAQAVDLMSPIQVARSLEGLLEMAPAIQSVAYEETIAPTRRDLVSIPLRQVLSIRLRMPTLKELTECSCAYLLDAPNGYRKCAYCKQLEAADLAVAGT